MRGLVFDYATVVDRLLFGRFRSQYCQIAIVVRVKLEHVDKWKIAACVTIQHENSFWIAIANQIAKVVNTATCAKRRVLLQISNRYFELDLGIHNKRRELFTWLIETNQVDFFQARYL